VDSGHDPMSETMFYILFALREERHGYGIMQHVHALTNGRIELGAGTVYSTLRRLERLKFITATTETDRRKNYVITARGTSALTHEARRIAELHQWGKELL
jgi:DNA-binding PadR family transcriptional regulator